MATLTKEEKNLKEAMKIILRDGKEGQLYNAAKDRYIALKTDERINNLAHELGNVDWTNQYKTDIETINKLIA